MSGRLIAADGRQLLRTSMVMTLVLVAAFSADAAPPDAGQVLQQQQQAAPLPPREGNGIVMPAPTAVPVAPGGAQVSLQGVVLRGNTVVASETLLAVVGDVQGRRYDLAGLRALADRVTAYYRESGYPFARALVPEQSLAGGQLVIEIIEGRYGKVEAYGEYTAQAEAWLSELKSGEVIHAAALERTTLLLDDLPGIATAPVMQPGDQIGTGNLVVDIKRDRPYSAEARLDNHGNRYTGRTRGGLDVHANSPLLFGDQLTARMLYSEEDLWLGSLDYSLPLGTSGLRATMGYAHTEYALGKEFSGLGAHGTAHAASVGLSYSIIRSQNANLSVSAGYQHRRLNDRQDTVGTDDSKRSQSLPVTLTFDRHDALGGGGVTWGSITWTHGKLDLDSGLAAADQLAARTDGYYDKLNLDIARQQWLGANFSLYGRVAVQWAADNLDSAEDMLLGGAHGVRAYPVGEGQGDEGVLTQFELRYSATSGADLQLHPYAFYDSGRVKVNHDAWAAGNNHRSIGGAGLGLRAGYKKISADVSAAWRTQGGQPQADTSGDPKPRIWLTVGYGF